MKRRDDITKEKIESMLATGMNKAEIARELKCSGETVLRRLQNDRKHVKNTAKRKCICGRGVEPGNRFLCYYCYKGERNADFDGDWLSMT